MKRRHFAKNIGYGVIAAQSFPLINADNFLNKNKSGPPIGLCNHSLRSLGYHAHQLIKFAIEHKLDAVLFNNFTPFESLEDSYLHDLKKLSRSGDIKIYVGAGNISEKSPRFRDTYGTAEELLKKAIRVAEILGSPIVGCRIGNIEDRYAEGGIEAHIEAVVKLMKSMRPKMLEAQLKFAFENHAGDMRTNELLGLIEQTGTDICGAFFDPANAVWAMEDPIRALKNLGSHILCTSVRDVQIWETHEGATFQGTAIGDGVIDYPLFVKTMRELCPGVPLNIETISNSARPIPFLKPEFWTGFPELSASEMASFLTFVKKGKKLEIIHPPEGIRQKDFDVTYQKAELLKSVDYLRAKCNAGLK